jgi:hypothetical protein
MVADHVSAGVPFKRKKVMPKLSLVTLFALCVICAVLLSGCSIWTSTAQHGETAAEGHVRHLRNARVNQESLMGDIDRALLFDTPQRTTPMRIP